VPRQQRGRECGEQDQREDAAVLIDTYRPGASDGRQRCDAGKCDDHAREQRQPAFEEWLFGARKYEGQDGQDAWT
jgi:hypothetical protein